MTGGVGQPAGMQLGSVEIDIARNLAIGNRKYAVRRIFYSGIAGIPIDTKAGGYLVDIQAELPVGRRFAGFPELINHRRTDTEGHTDDQRQPEPYALAARLGFLLVPAAGGYGWRPRLGCGGRVPGFGS